MLLCRAATLLVVMHIAAEGQAAGGSQELQQLKYIVKLLKDQVSDMTADVTAQLLGMTAQNTNLTALHTNMRVQMTELTAHVMGITAQNTNLMTLNTNMRAQMTELTAQVLGIKAQNTNLTARVSDLTAQNTNMTALLSDLTAQNTNTTTQLTDLTDHVFDLTEKNTNMTAHYTNLTAYVTWLNEQHGFKQWVENNTFNEDQSMINLSEITENPQSQDTSKQEPREWVTVIAGGYTDSSRIDVVQVIGCDSSLVLPDFKFRVNHNRMITIGTTLFSCGGLKSRTVATDSCHTIQLNEEHNTWQTSHPLPRASKEHHISGANGVIMAIYEDGAISITNGSKSVMYKWVFDQGSEKRRSCLAHNATHSYFLHRGIVYMNNDAINPADWKNISEINWDSDNTGTACFLFESELFVTRMDKLFIMNTHTFAVRQGASPNTPRRYHEMGVIDDRVAVLGGRRDDSNRLDSIETYDRQTDTWQTDDEKLMQPMTTFGIVSVLY